MIYPSPLSDDDQMRARPTFLFSLLGFTILKLETYLNEQHSELNFKRN